MPVRTKLKKVQNMVKKNSVISTMTIVHNMKDGFMIRKEECWVKRSA